MNHKKVIKTSLLFLTAIIWGIAFVAQSEGGKYIETFTFSAIRFIMAGIILIPFTFFYKDALDKDNLEENKNKPLYKKIFFIGGVLAGISLFVATNLQQKGITLTSVGKSGFITSMYIVFSPIIALMLGKKSSLKTWISVVVSIIGLFLLCVTDSITDINIGDVITLISAFFFAVQILIIDHYSPDCNAIKFTCVQFFTTGLISLVMMFIFENPEIEAIKGAMLPLLYSGILSCGFGYTIQVICQQDLSPVVGSLIMSLESVFSVIAGFLLLGQALSLREILGCILMFIAVIYVQLPEGFFKNIFKGKAQ